MTNSTNEDQLIGADTTALKAIGIYYETGLALLIIIGLPANLLTGIVAFRFLRQRALPLEPISTTFHVLILWNAVCNSLATIFNAFIIAAHRHVWILKNTINCNVFGFFSHFFAISAVWLPFITALNRYSVAKAIEDQVIAPWTVHKTNYILTITLTTIAGISALPFSPLPSYEETHLHGCWIRNDSKEGSIMVFASAVCLKCVPFLITTIIYIVIIMKYRHIRNRVISEAQQQQQHKEVALWKRIKGERQLIILMIATLIVLCITSMVGGLFLSLTTLSGLPETGRLLINSYYTISPFIVGFSSGRYRYKIRNMLLNLMAILPE